MNLISKYSYTFYRLFFALIIITIFFSDTIVIKPLGILGQPSVLFASLYVALYVIEIFLRREKLNISLLTIIFFSFIVSLVIGFGVSELDRSIMFKGEVPTLKFIKQVINILLWGVFFFIPYHFLSFNKKMEFGNYKLINYLTILFYSLLFIGYLDWAAFIFFPEEHHFLVGAIHHYFPEPYTNIYSWLIGLPRYRFVEGEPVHATIALQLFFIAYTYFLLKTKYKILSLVSIVLIVITAFLTFSRSGYLGIWLMLLLMLLTIAFFSKKLVISKSLKIIIILLFIFQTTVTFPFLNDSILKYYQAKFHVKQENTDIVTVEEDTNKERQEDITQDNKQEQNDKDQMVTQEELSNNTRAISVLISLDMLKEHPFFGVGWGQYGFHFGHYYTNYENAGGNNWEFKQYLNEDNEKFWPEQHSFFLRLISETGILGTLLILTILIIIYRVLFINLLKARWSSLFKVETLMSLMSLVTIMQLFGVMSGMNLVYIPFLIGSIYYINQYKI